MYYPSIYSKLNNTRIFDFSQNIKVNIQKSKYKQQSLKTTTMHKQFFFQLLKKKRNKTLKLSEKKEKNERMKENLHLVRETEHLNTSPICLSVPSNSTCFPSNTSLTPPLPFFFFTPTNLIFEATILIDTNFELKCVLKKLSLSYKFVCYNL